MHVLFAYRMPMMLIISLSIVHFLEKFGVIFCYCLGSIRYWRSQNLFNSTVGLGIARMDNQSFIKLNGVGKTGLEMAGSGDGDEGELRFGLTNQGGRLLQDCSLVVVLWYVWLQRNYWFLKNQILRQACIQHSYKNRRGSLCLRISFFLLFFLSFGWFHFRSTESIGQEFVFEKDTLAISLLLNHIMYHFFLFLELV